MDSITYYCKDEFGRIDRCYKVRLADNRYMLKLGCKLKTVTDTPEEDWKTAIAFKKQCIPKDAIITLTDVFMNLYGLFLRVDYEGQTYSIAPKNVTYFLERTGCENINEIV